MVLRLVIGFILCTSFSFSYGQERVPLSTLISEYSASSGVQFAYNPRVFSEIMVQSDPVKSTASFIALLDEANISYEEITSDRWLLKEKPRSEERKIQGYTLEGKVMEGNESPLTSALIFTSGGEFGSLSDADGKFQLFIPDNNAYEVCCQFLGYEVSCISSEDVEDGKIDFELRPKSIQIGEVKIKAKRIRFSIDQIKDSEIMLVSGSNLTNAMLGKDVIRSAQFIGGVDATDDLNATLSVRATSGMESLITLDGIPIYDPGSSFGIFSILNDQVVTKSTLYKNTFPIDYGEYIGGYLDCEGLTELKEKTSFRADINSLTSSLALQIPIKKKFQFSIAARSTNGSISNDNFYSKISNQKRNRNSNNPFFGRPNILTTDLSGNFGDIYSNLLYEANDGSKLTLSAILSRDFNASSYQESYTFRPPNSMGDQMVEVSESLSQDKTKGNLGISASYLKPFANKGEFFFQAYSSQFRMDENIKARVEQKRPNMTNEILLRSIIVNRIGNSNLKAEYRSDHSKKVSYRIGLDAGTLVNRFNYRSNTIEPIRQFKSTLIFVPYAGVRIHLWDRWNVDVGNRSALVPGNRKLYHSPRVNSQLRLTDHWWLKGSFSHNNQYFRPIEIERQLGQSVSVRVIENKGSIKSLRVNQWTVGTMIKDEAWSLNMDLYTRNTFGITQQLLLLPGLNFNNQSSFGSNGSQLFVGQNRTAGMDITSSVKKKNFEGMMSYALSLSFDRFEELFKNQFVPAQNNRIHQFNFFGAYNLKNWTFSSSYVFGSGIYTLDRLELPGNTDRPNLSLGQLYKQLPDYSRWDVNISYGINLPKGKLSIDAGVFNLLDHKNVSSEIYLFQIKNNGDKGVGAAEINLLNRIWILGLRYELKV